MGLVRRSHRLQRAGTALFVLLSSGYLFFNTTRILQERHHDYVQDDFWGQSSLLYNTKYQQKSWNLNEFVFGKDKSRNQTSYNQFLSIQSQYEAQKNYGLVDAYTEQMYYLEMSSLSDRALTLVQRNQAENIRDSLSLAAAEQYLQNPEYSFLKTPASVVGALAAYYTGRLVRVGLGNDWRLNLQSSGSGAGGIALLGVTRDGFSGAASKDPTTGQYRLLMNKRLLGATSATSGFNAATQTTSVGISHALSEGWTVGYDRSLSGSERNQESVRVNYSAGF